MKSLREAIIGGSGGEEAGLKLRGDGGDRAGSRRSEGDSGGPPLKMAVGRSIIWLNFQADAPRNHDLPRLRAKAQKKH
jgi:hypothetical protein